MWEDTLDKAPNQRLPKRAETLDHCVCDYVELANGLSKEEPTDVGTKDVNKQPTSKINERIDWMDHDHTDWGTEAWTAGIGFDKG